MKFTKRPLVIEAMQFDGRNGAVIRNWAHRGLPDIANSVILLHDEYGADHTAITVRTLEGSMFVNPGDWIIRGIQGEFYPCKPDIFEKTYEPAAAPPAPTPKEPWQHYVLAWLGQWRDYLPPEAVTDLQDVAASGTTKP